MLVPIECSCIICEVEGFHRDIGWLTIPLHGPLTYGPVWILVKCLQI